MKKNFGVTLRRYLTVAALACVMGVSYELFVFPNAFAPAGINGIVLTKLDGTAKGGIAFSIVRELGVPVMYVGVGEGIEELQAFSAREFVDALFE